MTNRTPTMTEPIHIVLAPDKNFAMPAGVALASVLQHSAAPGRLRFYILSPSTAPLDARTRAAYQKLAVDSGAKLEWIEYDRQRLDGLRVEGHLAPATYCRFLIPELLPRLERCLYLDADLVALDDLAALWDEDVSGAALGAVRDWEKCHGQRTERDYFNAGVLLMNLRRIRERGLDREWWRVTRERANGADYDHADQGVLNAVCAGDCKWLDPRWNIQTGAPLTVNPGIVHFTGRGKPWQFWLGHAYAGKFWRARWRTPWRWPSAAELGGLVKNLLVLNISPRKGCYRLSTLGMSLVNIRREIRKNV
ncbi:MAG: glycosyltransferase family 8 protein [Verrucomicrobiales bacterium]|nr:glycosyltransferase family 8 protein [Verrucomicrobiales bacterium]